MTCEDKTIWGIHAKDEDIFLKSNKIAIGWKEMGDLSKIEANRDAFRAKYEVAFPNETKNSIALKVGMLYRFCYDVKPGDYVIFPSKSNREVNIGIVEGDYTYEPQQHFANTRTVKWLKHLPRTAFSQGALYEIGSAMTFFTVKNYADEFFSALDNKKKYVSSEDVDDSIGATTEDIIESTKDFILKELSRQLKGYELEDFVADLLRAMGYRTTISPHGGDSGIDITAYKDELPPRILVQVKSKDENTKENAIQSLKGAMREGDYGLFVTLSNYTANAQKYLDSTPIIRGINGTELVELILKYYEDLSDKYKRMIPLKRVYIPVQEEQ